MPAHTLADALRSGETIVMAWVTLPDPLVAELVARSGFGAITLDVQHGLHDTGSVMRSVSAVAMVGKPALVRLAVDDFAFASRCLDFGAEAVIAPMINSAADARRLVAATKYPPLGERSWGPTRVMTLSGITDPSVQLETANRSTLAIAMIETKMALDAVDDILAVEGLDGVFVGPSDLSVTLTDGQRLAPNDAIVDTPLRDIAARAKAAGKIAGVFAGNGERVRFCREIGSGLPGPRDQRDARRRGRARLIRDCRRGAGSSPVPNTRRNRVSTCRVW
jgi:4-hydroxy-2-oxoheptanedioate aldolase